MTTATVGKDVLVYGDVQCLNCGRALARAIRRLSDKATAIRPARGETEINVVHVAGRGLRCRRCGGRAFIEFDMADHAPAA